MDNVIIFSERMDSKAVEQIRELSKQFPESTIRVMPDYHAGKGCVVGTTMTIADKVCPNHVGVDIGCLDKDTEFLTENGWKKISEYKDVDKVLQYNKNTGKANFEKPLKYIVKDCEEFYHINTKYGLDQMVCEEHKILAWTGIKSRGYKVVDYNAKDFVDKHNSLKKGISGGIKTTFGFANNGLGLKEIDIRIFVMVSADGTIRERKTVNNKIELHFSKERKVERAEFLLKEAGISYTKTKGKDGTDYIYFDSNNLYHKDLTIFWKANASELKILVDEYKYWDGTEQTNKNGFSFSTTVKEHADIIQFALATIGIRAGMQVIEYENKDWNKTYSVYCTKNEIVRFPERKIEKVKSQDGKKYCFTVPSGYFIIRRNNKISITGNCGVSAYAIEKKHNISHRLAEIDNIIKENIPSGKNTRTTESKFIPKNFALKVKADGCNIDRAMLSLGTLGGGNHFIEIGEDESSYILFVHSGSRQFGLQVATYWQNFAFNKLTKRRDDLIKKAISDTPAEKRDEEISKIKEIFPAVSKDNAYLDGEDMEHYLDDMVTAQNYAELNREIIVKTILEKLEIPFNKLNYIECIHNYIEVDRKKDKKILRKGAISAYKDETVIIPLNMKDGVIIGRGKGNPDWNFSAPHGAGRIYSRSQAKQEIDLEDFKKVMEGVYSTTVNANTIDEAPMAYKPAEEIINAIGQSVRIIGVIKPIYNFKAGE